MGYIYILENKINHKMYVGQTIKKLKYRLKGHINDSGRSNYPINNAIRKYGIEGFNIYSFECDEEDLDYFECGFIKQMNTLKPNGYNLDSGGNKQKHRHPDTIKKISETEKGKKMSIESRLKMSISRKGRIFSEEHKKNMSKSNGKKKKVRCIETGEIFDSFTLASKKYGIKTSGISQMISNKQKTAGGHKWEYA